MLIIQRRVGERIVMSSGVEVTVAAVTKRGVRLALKVPDGIMVLRGEVHDAIVVANAASMSVSADEAGVGSGVAAEWKTENLDGNR